MIDVINFLNTGLSTVPQETSKADKDLGKDAFMQLLVAQMTNQNPLEPMENTEFIAQLAQFSSLEQMQNIAAGMELLALSQTASTNSQMVNLIGKRVVVPGNQFSLDGQNPATLKFDFSGETTPAEIVIKDENGEVVRRLELKSVTTGTNSVQFDGKNEDGELLAAGHYTYEVVDSSGNAADDVVKYANFLVDAVAYNGTTVLLKSNGITIDLSDINEVIQ